jgi:hypothetical protein
VIDYVQQLFSDEPNLVVTYRYFTFIDTEKQKVSNFLCSSIADTCSNRLDTPEALLKAYKQSNHGQQLPSTESFLKMLHAVVEGFENVCLVIDALDECSRDNGERSKLLDILH